MNTPRALVEVDTWRTSTRSGGGGNGSNCVEVGTWRTSTRSGNSGQTNCVEIAACTDHSHGVAIRDSKHRAGAVLATDRPQWTAFLTDLKTGHYDN